MPLITWQERCSFRKTGLMNIMPFLQKVDSVTDLSARTKLQKEIMFRTVFKYPGSTFNVLIKNTINVFLSNNLISNIFNFFGYEWKKFKGSCYPYKTPKAMLYATYFLMCLYALLWVLFFLKLIMLLRKKDYETILVVLLLFIMIIIPGLLTGDGGSRFRLPFEHILFIFGLSFFSQIKIQKPLGF